jgi:hypothetical protein
MNKTTARYLRQLGLWLRFQGVEGPRIVTILLEVRTHVTESGEDPYETFGQPRTYAKAFAEGSPRRWLWGASLVVALAGFVASAYLISCEVASQSDQRPLPLGGHSWIVITVALLAAIVAWRAILVVAVRPLSSLASDEGDASDSWKGWVRQRRFTTVGVVIAIVATSAVWGLTLGNGFLNAPKLRVSSYAFTNATGPSNVNGLQTYDIAVSTVIYLAAPGPQTKLKTLSLSADWLKSYSQSSNLDAYPDLASAIHAAHNRNFSGTGNNAVSHVLKFGSYYLLQYFGEINVPFSSGPPTAESLVVGYSVNRTKNKYLDIALPLNYSSDN